MAGEPQTPQTWKWLILSWGKQHNYKCIFEVLHIFSIGHAKLPKQSCYNKQGHQQVVSKATSLTDCSLCVPLEKLGNRGWCKINIWKTEGMLELVRAHSCSCGKPAPFSAKCPLPHPCPGTALQLSLSCSSSAGTPRVTRLGSARPHSPSAGSNTSWAALLGSPSICTVTEVPPLISRAELRLCSLWWINLCWVLCKDFQINRCWLCQWDTLLHLMAESQLEQALGPC